MVVITNMFEFRGVTEWIDSLFFRLIVSDSVSLVSVENVVFVNAIIDCEDCDVPLISSLNSKSTFEIFDNISLVFAGFENKIDSFRSVGFKFLMNESVEPIAIIRS